MLISDNMTEIIVELIGLLGLVITMFLVPYLNQKRVETKARIEEVKSKLSKEQQEEIEYWTKIAINAFEKKFEGEFNKGPIKKDKVIAFVRTLNVSISDEALSHLIDALVEELINKPLRELEVINNI